MQAGTRFGLGSRLTALPRSRSLRRGAVTVSLVTLGVSVGLVTGTASANSPVIKASGGQCQAQWVSAPNHFVIRDADNKDSDWCYIDFTWDGSHSSKNRQSWAQDHDTAWHDLPTLTPQSSIITWHVCKERQNDSDVCAAWRDDAA